MEQSIQAKTAKSKATSAATVSLRVKRETKKRVQAELAKVNKKDFGKKVRCDELIGTALSLLTEQHFKELQDGSLTNADRLEQKFREHIRKHGPMTKDAFLGTLLGSAQTVAENGNG